jgi:hypothetical protein
MEEEIEKRYVCMYGSSTDTANGKGGTVLGYQNPYTSMAMI